MGKANHTDLNQETATEQLKILSSENLERALTLVFTTSSGALVASLTFRNSLIGTEPSALWLLGFAWFFFAVSTSCQILRLLLLYRAYDGIAEQIKELEINPDTKVQWKTEVIVNKIVARTMYVQLGSFFSAMLTFVAFGLLNLDVSSQ